MESFPSARIKVIKIIYYLIPRDILWDNLPIRRTQQLLRMFVMNIVIFVGLSIFAPLTTILSILENLRDFSEFQRILGKFLENPTTFAQHLAYHICFDYIPSILMLLMSSTMIYIFWGTTSYIILLTYISWNDLGTALPQISS